MKIPNLFIDPKPLTKKVRIKYKKYNEIKKDLCVACKSVKGQFLRVGFSLGSSRAIHSFSTIRYTTE